MKTYEDNGYLVICLEGRIDSSNAQETEEEIHRLIAANPGKGFMFDAGELNYISSAGLRIFLRIHQTVRPGVIIRNVTPEVNGILETTGFSTFLDIRKKPRVISLEGCPIIGKGAVSDVYRLDADTVVKLYTIDDSLPMIENELKQSRRAFLKGIPTAMPFDIIQAGDRYGTVFEMIKARNCSSILAEEPERLDEIIGIYAAFLRQVHGAKAEHGELPDARDHFLRYLDTAAETVPADVCGRIRDLIRDMPEDLCMIHGDIQLKNVMFSNGEMILIDMETLSSGNPVFEFAGLFMDYVIFNEDEPDNMQKFMGLSAETCEKLFYETFRRYMDTDEETYRKALDRIALLGYVRFLYVLKLIGGGNPDCHEQRLRHSREHLEELVQRVETLAI